MRITIRRVAICGLLTMMCTACGYRSALYMPQVEKNTPSSSSIDPLGVKAETPKDTAVKPITK